MAEEQKFPFIVKGTNIRHNKKVYKAGRRIELTIEEAKRLRPFLEPLEEETCDTSDVSGRELAWKEKIADLQQALAESDRRVTELLNEVDTLQGDMDKLTIELNQLRQTNDTTNATNAELITAGEEKDQVIADRDKTIEQLNAQIAELKKDPAPKGGKK